MDKVIFGRVHGRTNVPGTGFGEQEPLLPVVPGTSSGEELADLRSICSKLLEHANRATLSSVALSLATALGSGSPVTQLHMPPPLERGASYLTPGEEEHDSSVAPRLEAVQLDATTMSLVEGRSRTRDIKPTLNDDPDYGF